MSYTPKVAWEARVVASVTRWIERGKTFDEAWARMLAEVPIPHTGHGIGPARLFVVEGDDPEELGLVEAMRGFCEDAYYGRRPGLARFEIAMLVGGDGSSPARRVGEIRTAA